MRFVDLGVLAKLEAAVLCLVNGKASDKLAWDEDENGHEAPDKD